jgi:hypothetical protein
MGAGRGTGTEVIILPAGIFAFGRTFRDQVLFYNRKSWFDVPNYPMIKYTAWSIGVLEDHRKRDCFFGKVSNFDLGINVLAITSKARGDHPSIFEGRGSNFHKLIFLE